MTGVSYAISNYAGIVIVSDPDTDPSRQTSIIPISNNCITLVVNNRDAVKDFFHKHIMPKKPTSNSIIRIIEEELSSYVTEHTQPDFSFYVYGFHNELPFCYQVLANGGKIEFGFKNSNYQFITHARSIADYIIAKIYSPLMSLNELKNLTIFTLLQYIKIFRLRSTFNITVISNDVIKTLSRRDIQTSLSKQDHIDNILKKSFRDFFIEDDSTK